MARLGMIELDQLPTMQVLEDLDSEAVLEARMTEFVDLWKESDPPAGAQYDVASLETDPIKLTQEASTYFELLLRDRVNQAAKAVTLAFASGSDLDAIGSRYPGGVPRTTGESDDHYRSRIWLSVSTLSPYGVYDSYVFWASTIAPELRDATAIAKKRGTPDVVVTIMADGNKVELGSDSKSVTAFPSPTPTITQINTVRDYILKESRKALTDVVTVRAPKIYHVNYKIRYWLFPSWDQKLIEPELYRATAELIEKQRWIGYSHTQAAIEGALMKNGVFNIVVDSPADTEITLEDVVVVDSVKLTYAGRSGFEEPIEP